MDNKIKNRINQLQEEYNNIYNLKIEEEKQLEQAQKQLQDIISSLEIAQEAAQQLQQLAHKQIADIVNKCLQAIFDDSYEFQIQFSPKRNKTEAKPVFIRNGKEIENVGGGILDVASFALRLSNILLSRKSLQPIMLLDEPFKNVSKSKGYLERIPEMMIMLSEEFGIQFIQVTHIDELKIGKVIEL
jgi:hypothetical protein